MFFRVLQTAFLTHFFAVGLPGPQECALFLLIDSILVLSVGTSAVTYAYAFSAPILLTVSLAVSTFIVSV